MIDLKDFEYEELENFIVELGEKKFRAAQIYKWLHLGVTSYDEMTDISKSLREKLEKISYVSTLKTEEKFISKLDGTVKYLFSLPDGNAVESVVMRYHHGLTICISTQVGCRMGCRFCASTIGGLYRNLTAGEILNQVIFAQKDLGERISNIVLMGIGEPMDNYDNVVKFLKNVNNEKGLNIGLRHITISTCGVVPGIIKLADEGLPVTLTISLHAPNDAIRDEIMPVNRSYKIAELLEACRSYIKTTGRRVTFEYAVIEGINSAVQDAKALAALLRGMQCHVNLIPVNPIAERSFRGRRKTAELFQKTLEELGINATVRRTLGSDIQAACGQLRRNAHEEETRR